MSEIKNSLLRVLMLGDVIGRPGRKALLSNLPAIKNEKSIDVTIANGENASGGIGLQKNAAADLFSSGVDVITSGNHIWQKSDGFSLVKETETILRPSNYPDNLPGKGSTVLKCKGVNIGVICVQGRTFMQAIDSPFSAVIKDIDTMKDQDVKIILVDFHAEATSEKEAMGFYLMDKVSLLAGTHTHVQTADEKILV